MGRNLEVRARATENGWEVRCFENDTPVGPRYSVSWEVSSDFDAYHGLKAVDELMALAEGDAKR